ncbi:MAG: DUF1992 domain-containing protein [Chloroflexi bacterium]|nr:DUF1992 domain-containing protein [Chloroflexota bacterium]
MEDIDRAIARLAEAKILEAIENGAFEDLPGRGKPLAVEDLSLVAEDLRVGYILLKNAGYLPEELELHKEIASLERLMDCCARDEEKKYLRSKLLTKTLRYGILMERRKRRQGPPFSFIT